MKSKLALLNPKKSIRMKLFFTFLIPFLIVGGLTFALVKYLTGHTIEEYVLPQFEQILESNGENFNETIDPSAVEEAIQNPEGDHANLLNNLNAFMEGKERLEYVYILAQEGDKQYIVGLSGSEDVMVESPFTADQAAAMNNQEVVVTDIYEDQWGTHKSYFAPIEGTNAIIGVDMSTKFVDQLNNRINLFLAGFIGLSIIIGIVLSVVFGNRLNVSIQRLLASVKKISHGDLTEKVEVDREDEFGQLALATNEMTEGLRELVESVTRSSLEVSAQSEELTQASVEVREGGEQIATTMQELSTGSESQALSSTQLAELMEQFGQKIKVANQDGKDVSLTSKNVLSMTEHGSQLMTKSVQQMGAIHQIVKDSVEKVQGLDQQSKEISKLVKVIQDIAEQTNLLSLNAAIEAARAGEHGKGFAVVADEVRKLAEQVSLSIGDITNIVNNIQSESGKVVSALEHGYGEVDEGTKQIEVTGQTFGDINESVNNMARKIQSISDNLVDIESDSQLMNTSIEEIASISEESAAGVQEVAASSQQTSSSMEEVSSSAQQLAELADQLNEQVRRFQL